MSFDVEQYVRYKIANVEVRPHPFPHFYVQQIFPEDYYRELRARLPALERYTRIDETGTVAKGLYQARYVCATTDLEEQESEQGAGGFWAELNTWMLGEAFAALMIDKFRPGIAARFGPDVTPRVDTDCRLVRDLTSYAIAPHTDTPSKLVSLLFYLPEDDRYRRLGTSIFVPKQAGFRCEGTAHHDFAAFNKVATMEFLPNTLLGFLKTDRAFHGVDEIADQGVVRDLLLYNVYVKKLVVYGKPGEAARTPSSEPAKV